MVKLADLSPIDQKHMLDKIPALPDLGLSPWVPGGPLSKRRVALITTAGIHRRGDRPFGAGGRDDYSVIPRDATAEELVMSQYSVNFDRTGFQQDINVVFPIDRLKELEREGAIGSVAEYHYAFVGAGSPITRLEPKGREVAKLLKQDGVDAVLLTPV